MRKIFIDYIPTQLPGRRLFLHTVDDIGVLYEDFFNLEAPPDLVLDISGLSAKYESQLLKFIEEYRGRLYLIAKDPVSGPILSRFSQVEKHPTIVSGKFVQLRIKNVSRSIENKVRTLFGLETLSDREPNDESV